MVLETAIIAVAIASTAVLLSKRVRENRSWRATVTPLASIIGSGFLVIVPLLGNAVGGYAPFAMLAIVSFAYWIGFAIRFNIVHTEPLLAKPECSPWLSRLSNLSSAVLGFAYFISVTFYLRLLSSFALQGVDSKSDFIADALTTAILLCIGAVGWFRGLSLLERLEEYSVSIKLAIIASLVVGWTVYDTSHMAALHDDALFPNDLDGWYVVRLLAGVLIVVQGFETSRYLGDEYDADTRVKTMRRAQLISGVVYVMFVLITVPTFGFLGPTIEDTAIIDLSVVVSPVLPAMLVIAALMSQFSAAVADTVGAGGLLTETLGKRFHLPAKAAYVVVAIVGTALVWTTNIFEIISLASRAFAIYYSIQSIVAMITAYRVRQGQQRFWFVCCFALLSLLLMVAAIIAVPAG